MRSATWQVWVRPELLRSVVDKSAARFIFKTILKVKRDALIGEAEAKRDSGIEEAKAEEQRMEAKLKNDTDIAMSKRDFELKKASYDTEVNTAKAEAEMAYALQAAKVQARIKEEEMQVKVVERWVDNLFWCNSWSIETISDSRTLLFRNRKSWERRKNWIAK